MKAAQVAMASNSERLISRARGVSGQPPLGSEAWPSVSLLMKLQLKKAVLPLGGV